MSAPMTKADYESKGSDILSAATRFQVVDHDTYKFAANFTKECIAYKKFATLLFEDAKKKAWELHKSLATKQKKLQEPFMRAESILRNKIATFILEEKKKVEEENIGRIAKGIAPVIADPIPEKEGISSREDWAYEVINEDEVPSLYKVIDHKKLGACVRALKDSFRCPGVRVFKREVTIVRSV